MLVCNWEWRPRPDSNRGTRICSPLRSLSATWPLPFAPRKSGARCRVHALSNRYLQASFPGFSRTQIQPLSDEDKGMSVVITPTQSYNSAVENSAQTIGIVEEFHE